MSEKPDTNNDMQKLLDQACQHIEHLVDKRIAADKENQRLDSHLRARNLLLTMMSLVVSLAVGAGAIVANGYAENQDRDNKVIRDGNKRKWEIINGISSAITSIREGKEIAELYCGSTLTTEKRLELEMDRIKRQYELVNKGRPMVYFFSDNFRVLLKNFLEWDSSIKDYCSPSAPSEEEWKEKQKEIEMEMVKSPVTIFIDNRR